VDLIALAAKDFERPLLEEVSSRIIEQRGRLFVLKGKSIPVWAQNVWLDPEIFQFKSISEAVDRLRGIQRNWWLHSSASHRRAALVQKGLPPLKAKALVFPSVKPQAELGSFTLFDEKTMVYSPHCSNPYPDGELNFVENKIGPPSRAYLKLWETFTLLERRPQVGEKVLDLGSSPGGWTWVLDQLGSEVLSVDKAPFADSFKPSPRVKFIAESAFALEPKVVGRVDWLFSDVICYPERLLELVKKWLKAEAARNFVCTIKFQGPTNHEVVREFMTIPGSKVRHLHCNRHELTWTLIRE
jgi:23S rRNA (cytidine2498-2'-O)-methyltransferase